MVSLVENEGTTKTPTKPPDEAKEQGPTGTRPAQHEKHHAGERQHHQHLAVEVPVVESAMRQYPGVSDRRPGRTEVAGPMSGFRAPLLAATVPPYVSGAMKSRGFRHRRTVRGRDTGSQRKGRAVHTVGSPAAGRIDWVGRGHRCFHRTRGGLRSRLCDPRTPKPTRAAGADLTDRRCCR
jgi:hypothetical protein